MLIKSLNTWQFKALNISLLVMAFITHVMGVPEISRLFVLSFALTNAFEIGVQAGSVKASGALNASEINKIHRHVIKIHVVGLLGIASLVVTLVIAAHMTANTPYQNFWDFVFSGVCVAHYCLFGIYAIQREELN
jgi:hypothetical protein